MNGKYKYYAFISYSHKDSEWAKWLQHELEYYQLPSTLNGKPGLPSSFRPVFRDEDELSGGDLKPQITSALASSNYLIVICSPNSAQSKYVNEEIKEFIEIGTARQEDYTKRIFPLIIEGKPHQDENNKHLECFPEVLNNISKNVELVAGDVNATGRNHAFIKILAGTLYEKNVAFSDLWNKYEHYKIEEETKKKEAEDRLYRANARFIADKAFGEIEKGNAYSARRALLELYGSEPSKYPYVAEADKVLRRAVYEDTLILDLGRKLGRINIFSIVLSNQGDFFAVATYNSEDSILIYKTLNGEQVGSIKGVPCCAYTKMSFSHDDNSLLVTTSNSVHLYNLNTFELVHKWEYPSMEYGDYIIGARWDYDNENIITVLTTGKVIIYRVSDFTQTKTLQFEISKIKIDYGTHYIEDSYSGEVIEKHYVSTCKIKDFVIYKDHIYASCTDEAIRAVNYNTDDFHTKKIKGGINSICLSSDNCLVLGCNDSVKIYNAETLKLKQTFYLETYTKGEYIEYANYSDNILITCSISENYSSSIIRFFLYRNKELHHISNIDIKDPAIIRTVSTDREYSKILYLTDRGKIRLWSPQYTPKSEKIIASIDRIFCIPDSSHALAYSSDSYSRVGNISLLDYNTNEIIKTLEVDLDDPIATINKERLHLITLSLSPYLITLSNDGKYYIKASGDSIEIIDTITNQIYKRIRHKVEFGFRSIYISSDDSTLITFSQQTIQYWKFPELELIKELSFDKIRFGSKSTIITKHGHLITNSFSGNIFIIELDKMLIIKELICPDDYTHLNIIALSPDERYIAAASSSMPDYIYVWEFESGLFIKQIDIHDTIKDISFSSDNSKILVATMDKLISCDWGTFEDLITKQKGIFTRPYLLEEEKVKYYL